MGVTHAAEQTFLPGPPDQVGADRPGREWWWWIAPRPFTLVSSVVYLAALYYTFWGGDCSTPGEYCGSSSWNAITVIALLALLALDRLDYRLYGEVPPARVGVALLALRLTLMSVVVGLLGWWVGVFILALLPYTASFYFGIRGASITAVVVGLAETPMIALSAVPYMTRIGYYREGKEYVDYVISDNYIGEFFSRLTLMTIVIVFVVSAARTAYLERSARRQVEALLARLDASHDKMRRYSEQTLQATEERNRVAQEIHSRVGHYLAEVGVQIQKALALLTLDPEQANQAVRNAKESVSQALADARRSVTSLRISSNDPDFPRSEGISTDTTETGVQTSPPERGIASLLATLFPRPYDLAATTMYWAVVIPALFWIDLTRPWRPFALVGIALLLTLIDMFDFRRFGERPPLEAGIIMLAARVMLFLLLFVGLGVWNALLFIALIPYLCFIYFGDKVGYAMGALIWLGISLLGLMSLLNDLQSFQPLGPALAGYAAGLLVISFIVAVVVSTARVTMLEQTRRARAAQLLTNLKESYVSLKVGSQMAIAAVKERNNLARDIHDGLGHYLTVAGVQLENALAYRAIKPEVADQALIDAQRMVREALREVRETVGALKEPQRQSLGDALRELVDKLGRTGPKISLHIEGSEEGYSKQSTSALFRATQEGITNIHKHANAKHARLYLHLGESEALLELTDDGEGFSAEANASKSTYERGYGLQSMEERLGLVGGSLQISSLPGHGTRVTMRVGKANV